jgi:DNA-binding GntR family transcriptional regulator
MRHPMRCSFEEVWRTIAEDLRGAIITGELTTGERLKTADIAGRYGVSSTPVREALRHLESLGFVHFIPRKMGVVKEFSTREIEEIYTIQVELEGLAARLTSRRCSARELQKLKKNQKQMEAAYEKGKLDEYIRMNAEFHRLFSQFSGNQRLMKMIENTSDHIERFRFLILKYPGKPRDSLLQHQTILEALQARDPEAAEQAVKLHVTCGYELLRKIIESVGPKYPSCVVQTSPKNGEPESTR